MTPDAPELDPLALHDRRQEHVETLAILHEIRDEQRALRALLERERIRRPGLSRLHHAALVPLLEEISSAVGATTWNGRELVVHAATKDARLLRGIEAACGPRDAGMVRRLGKLLAQADGQVVAGFLVTCCSEGGRDGCEWSVTRV